MMIKLIGLSAAAIVVLAAAAPAPASNKCDVSFAANVQPILNANCVACHQNASPASGVSLQRGVAYRNVVNVPSPGLPGMMLVKPGHPEKSFLYLKMMGTHGPAGGAGTIMPPGAKLGESELGIIRRWIGACKAAQ